MKDRVDGRVNIIQVGLGVVGAILGIPAALKLVG